MCLLRMTYSDSFLSWRGLESVYTPHYLILNMKHHGEKLVNACTRAEDSVSTRPWWSHLCWGCAFPKCWAPSGTRKQVKHDSRKGMHKDFWAELSEFHG